MKDVQQEGLIHKKLSRSTRAVSWRIDWETATFSHMGPQVENLLGWPSASWVSVHDWVARIHPDDRDRVAEFCMAQALAGIDHQADYRALIKDGGYVWIRDVVHVLRNERGEVSALVGFMLELEAGGDTSLSIAFDAIEHRVRSATATYKFTEAEMRIAMMLARGFPSKKIAQTTGTSVATVRTHVQSIMKKTGTQRQIGLLSLLLASDG